MADAAARVLIVDDEQLIHDVVGTILGLEEYEVESVRDVAAAWTALERSTPDLVVSDVMMPDVDGLELCRRIRADERFAGLPVILLTARDAGSDKREAMDAGADAYVTKPFSPLDLLDHIERLIESTR